MTKSIKLWKQNWDFSKKKKMKAVIIGCVWSAGVRTTQATYHYSRAVATVEATEAIASVKIWASWNLRGLNIVKQCSWRRMKVVYCEQANICIFWYAQTNDIVVINNLASLHLGRDVGEAYPAETEASGSETEAFKLMAEARPRRGVAQSRGGLETEAIHPCI